MNNFDAYSDEVKDCLCECSDPGCPTHEGDSICENKAEVILFRMDMDDETGTAFCRACADDAMDSGLFTEER